jgi:alkylation response protein AidB-like acyl-CoA dehydrogenase
MAVEAPSTAVPVESIASHAPAVDREGRFPEEGLAALRESGLLGLCVPPSFGGQGGGPLEMVDVVEQVAGACASTAMVYVMHVVGAQTLVAGTGPDEEGPKADALGAVAAGRHLTTLAYSERGSRGHFWAQVSRARINGAGVVLDADKSWATAAGHVDSYVLACGAAGSRVRSRPSSTSPTRPIALSPFRACSTGSGCAGTCPRRWRSADCAWPPTAGSATRRAASG